MTTTPPEADPVAALTTHVSAAAGDAGYVTECVAEADQLVARHLTADVVQLDGTVVRAEIDVPTEVRARAVLEVGADLFHRRAAKNGISTFGDNPDVPPVRIRRDPLDAARPILAPWLGGPFA